MTSTARAEHGRACCGTPFLPAPPPAGGLRRSLAGSGLALVPALLWIASAAATVAGCRAMASGGMRMPGGWTMSMAWMRMPGQTRLGATAMFLAMWLAMTVAMMLPSLAPVLQRCQRAVGFHSGALAGRLTALVGLGYLAVWMAFGAAIHPAGVALAALTMHRPDFARAVPALGGAAVLAAGLVQRTRWKARRLACCRGALRSGGLPARAGAAWRAGLLLGLDCCVCCAAPMAVLLVAGVMDLPAMAAVTAAITAERLAPAGERVARAAGALAVAAGVVLLARAAGLP